MVIRLLTCRVRAVTMAGFLTSLSLQGNVWLFSPISEENWKFSVSPVISSQFIGRRTALCFHIWPQSPVPLLGVIVLPGGDGMSRHLRPIRVLGDHGAEDLLLVVVEAGGDQVRHQLVPGLRLQTQLHLFVVEEDKRLCGCYSNHHVVPDKILTNLNASNIHK